MTICVIMGLILNISEDDNTSIQFCEKHDRLHYIRQHLPIAITMLIGMAISIHPEVINIAHDMEVPGMP